MTLLNNIVNKSLIDYKNSKNHSNKESFISLKEESRFRLKGNEKLRHLAFKYGGNVLVVGDFHAPFDHKDYLSHCEQSANIFNCEKTIMIGDVVDMHSTSYHESDPDGMSAGDELDEAIKSLKKYYKVFPDAIVTIGNHDERVLRKIFSAGVSKRWIKNFSDVLEVPKWKFVFSANIDNVYYVHGTGSGGEYSAKNRALHLGQSVVQGHVHHAMNISWINYGNTGKSRFGMQVGCGIDSESYAMSYGKNYPKGNALGCSAVLFSGKLPVNIPMI